jgi:hypothetical protein
MTTAFSANPFGRDLGNRLIDIDSAGFLDVRTGITLGG